VIKTYQELLKRVEKSKIDQDLDLSSGEDLSVGIMNLISIEEHLFFTAEKTGKKEYYDLLNEVRLMRVELLKKIIKEYEGEQWCLSKHFLAASMRLIEVGTKELKKGNRKEAEDMFTKAYKLYSLFWGLNLSNKSDLKVDNDKVNFIDEKGKSKGSESAFSKLGSIVQKALDCCRE
jgi:hypothetical protein